PTLPLFPYTTLFRSRALPPVEPRGGNGKAEHFPHGRETDGTEIAPGNGGGDATMSRAERDLRSTEAEPIKLLTQVTCPHCWESLDRKSTRLNSSHRT